MFNPVFEHVTVTFEFPEGLPQELEGLFYLDSIPPYISFVGEKEYFRGEFLYHRVIFEAPWGDHMALEFVSRLSVAVKSLNISQYPGFVVYKLNGKELSRTKMKAAMTLVSNIATLLKELSKYL